VNKRPLKPLKRNDRGFVLQNLLQGYFIRRYGTQHNDIQNYGTQHKGLIKDTWLNLQHFC
jgi:hypothetical protein